MKNIIPMINGAVILFLLLVVCTFFYEASWEACKAQGYFIHENQKYECKPTGEWVEE